VRHHCWLTQEPLKTYLKAEAAEAAAAAAEDSGDEGNEATELLEMDDLDFEEAAKKGFLCSLSLSLTLSLSLLSLTTSLCRRCSPEICYQTQKARSSSSREV
jgi:hypothetical protein